MSAKKTTSSKAKKATVNKASIISAYMNTVLETEEWPKSVYKFCKENNITEAVFYNHFASFQSLQKGIWREFFDHSISLMHKTKGFDGYGNKEKMLAFFYTFFELLSANRSYVLFALNDTKTAMKNMMQLSQLRNSIKDFAKELIEEANSNKQLKILKQPVFIFSEGAWLQTIFILKYWMDDDSEGFEKTDIVIEKSVRAIFDVFETTPLESIVDFGKFLWKDKMN